MIIIEGPDNAGKTTLMKQLMEDFDLKQAPLKFDPHDKEDVPKEVVDFYDKVMDYMGYKTEDELINEVWDRVYFSELVYGPLKRGEVGLTQEQALMVPKIIQAHRPLIIMCMTHKANIINNLAERQQYVDYHEIGEMIDRYNNLLNEMEAFTPYFYRYDYKYNSYENVRRYVELYLMMREGGYGD